MNLIEGSPAHTGSGGACSRASRVRKARALALTFAVLAVAPATAGDEAAPDAPATAGDEAAPDAPDPAPLPVLEAEPVEVVADAPTPADQAAPTSVTTRVDLEEREQHDLDLAAPLSQAPATVLRRYGGPGSLVTVSLRGSAADQVRVRLGDLPLTPPGGGLVDLSALPPSLLASAAVTRGSEGAAYGAGALGGVLHLEPLGQGADQLVISGAGGSFGTFDGAVTGRTQLGTTQLAAGLDLQGTGGRFSYERDLTPNWSGDRPVVEVRENNDALLGSALLSARTHLEGGTLRATAFGHRGRRGVPGMLGFPTPEARATDTRGLAGASFRGAPRGPLYLSWGALAWAAGDGYAFEPGTSLDMSGPSETGRRVLGAEGHAEALAGVHRLGARVGGSHEALWGTGVDTGRAAGSLALSDELWLLDERVSVHGALRLEAFEGLAAQLSPKLGAAVTPLPGLTLSANFGRAMRAPSLQELYRQHELMQPNPELRPEAALTLDAAVRLEADAGWLRLAAWHSRYEDLISYEWHSSFRSRPFNTRDARVLGLEVEGEVRPFPWLRLAGAYTFTDAKNLAPAPNEKVLPYRPPHRGALRAEAEGRRVSGYVEVEGQSRFWRNRPATKEIPGRVLVAAGAIVRVSKALSVGVQATNLLDDRRLQDVFGYPLPGRTLLVTARLALAGDTPSPAAADTPPPAAADAPSPAAGDTPSPAAADAPHAAAAEDAPRPPAAAVMPPRPEPPSRTPTAPTSSRRIR